MQRSAPPSRKQRPSAASSAPTSKPSQSTPISTIMYYITVLSVSFLALLQVLSVLGQSFAAPPVTRSEPNGQYVAYENAYGADIPPKLLDVLKSSQSRTLGQYPTSFTKGIIPKQLHSHNDYWRDVPFYSAISVGAISVEADIWLVNGTLYVGHEESALTPKRTFESLYVNPILDTLKRQNPTTQFVDGSTTANGVFDTDSGQTLYLWLDCKTDGHATFAAANAALAPLRTAGYLTRYSKRDGVTPGAVTVIGTGNTPLNAVQGVSPRHFFWDAPLPELDGAFANITADVSPIASTDFAAAGFADVGRHGLGRPVFDDEELRTLRAQIAAASKKGIGARYWDTPGWPVRTRNAVWTAVWTEGAALVNVDDLADAAFGDWSS